MKKIILTVFILTAPFYSISQTCEERENKLLEVFGGFSAGMIYNTYALIGAISDGYKNGAYDALTVSDLMNAQKKVADKLLEILEDLKNGGYLKDKDDQDYLSSIINILKELKKQAQLLTDIANNKSLQKQEAYDNQRKQNWSTISKLMGIEE